MSETSESLPPPTPEERALETLLSTCQAIVDAARGYDLGQDEINLLDDQLNEALDNSGLFGAPVSIQQTPELWGFWDDTIHLLDLSSDPEFDPRKHPVDGTLITARTAPAINGNDPKFAFELVCNQHTNALLPDCSFAVIGESSRVTVGETALLEARRREEVDDPGMSSIRKAVEDIAAYIEQLRRQFDGEGKDRFFSTTPGFSEADQSELYRMARQGSPQVYDKALVLALARATSVTQSLQASTNPGSAESDTIGSPIFWLQQTQSKGLKVPTGTGRLQWLTVAYSEVDFERTILADLNQPLLPLYPAIYTIDSEGEHKITVGVTATNVGRAPLKSV